MHQASIRPELIYAYLQTDRIISDPKSLDPAELAEYESAIDEYHEKRRQGEPDSFLLDPFPYETIMRDTLSQVQLIFSYYVANLSRPATKDNEEAYVQFFTDFLLTTATRSLRDRCPARQCSLL